MNNVLTREELRNQREIREKTPKLLGRSSILLHMRCHGGMTYAAIGRAWGGRHRQTIRMHVIHALYDLQLSCDANDPPSWEEVLVAYKDKYCPKEDPE